MAELDNKFDNEKPVDYNWEAVLDLDRLIPCVQGGSVVEHITDDSVKAEIVVSMGAMSMTFTGTVAITSQDPETHTAVLQVKSREKGGQGYANAEVTFTLDGTGGNIHTSTQISGKAASMGEGVMVSVLDGLIGDFAERLKQI